MFDYWLRFNLLLTATSCFYFEITLGAYQRLNVDCSLARVFRFCWSIQISSNTDTDWIDYVCANGIRTWYNNIHRKNKLFDMQHNRCRIAHSATCIAWAKSTQYTLYIDVNIRNGCCRWLRLAGLASETLATLFRNSFISIVSSRLSGIPFNFMCFLNNYGAW